MRADQRLAGRRTASGARLNMDGTSIARWKPATVTKQPAGAQFLVAFTDKVLVNNFSKNSPTHSFVLLVDAGYLLGVVPQDHGIAFNVGGENCFEWTAEDLSAYMSSERSDAS